MTTKAVRCAIYTRKSSEEGLDQSFNSLEAQRDACSAFIRSQRHEGWKASSVHYDDGGFSGGSMERPALERLLGDIQARKVDTIVVYKVDRLTRSLADFAKIIEILDANSTSFVSVTQQFNTTSSMGRLTLNVLLSFAQFEREITGERIRDKIAASKKKGMWMGGTVPFGYDCIDRKLCANATRATVVRQLFRNYIAFGSVGRLEVFLKELARNQSEKPSSELACAARFSRGALYHLLSNCIYIGWISHKGHRYRGQHEPIVSRQLWERAAALLRKNDQAKRVAGSKAPSSILTGKLFDAGGVRFTPTHSVKKGKRYRYYTSQAVVRDDLQKPTICRFPADELERAARDQLHLLLKSPGQITVGLADGPTKTAIETRAQDLARNWSEGPVGPLNDFLRGTLVRAVVGNSETWFDLSLAGVVAKLLDGIPCPNPVPGIDDKEVVRIKTSFRSVRCRGELRIVSPHDTIRLRITPSLVHAIARSHDWYCRIVSGEFSSVADLASAVHLTKRYVRRVLQCAVLSPEIVEAVLTGRHRTNLSLRQILSRTPLEWKLQRSAYLQPMVSTIQD